jgi:hypothetical protein
VTVLACATHWYTALAYFAPVLGVGGWLGWVTLRERLPSRREKARASATAPSSG